MGDSRQLEGAGTLERTEGGYRVQFRRDYRRPVEELWQAISAPEGLDSWYPTRLRTDGVVGNLVTETFENAAGIAEPAAPGTLTAYDPPHLFEYRIDGPVEAQPADRLGIQTIRMEARAGNDGSGSTLIFTHDVETLPTALDVLGGWHYCLEFLALHLGEDGEPTRENLGRFNEYYEATYGQA